MKFGVREICDVVFKAKAQTKIGSTTFKKGQPVLYIDTATASSMEQGTTSVYATGGKGNTRLIAWEGEKTMTFTVTDALLSPIGFSVLSGAGLFKSASDSDYVHVHTTANAVVEDGSGSTDIEIDLSDALGSGESIDSSAPVFVTVIEDDGSLTGEILTQLTVTGGNTLTKATGRTDYSGKTVFVDFYIKKKSANVSEIQIDGSNFGGYYYVEASTLFRRQSDGVDMPCEITLPHVKIQSNFTFSMASSGDPSTFDFTMDALPGYTYFDPTRKVICVMQIIEDQEAGTETRDSVMKHDDSETIKEIPADSIHPAQYAVTFSASPAAGGTVTATAGGTTYTSGNKINEGSSVVLTASAETGYTFSAWKEGTTTLSSANPYTHTLDKDITIQAVFTSSQQ